MEKEHSVRVNLLLSNASKELYDSLPHGARRALLSKFMEAYVDLHIQYGALALHAITQDKFSIELDLKDEAKRVLDDATGNEKTSRTGDIVSGDGGQGAKRTARADKNKARGKAA